MKQTALITGASGGIGRACAVVFAEHGYNLVLVARTERKLDEIKRELENKYGVTVTTVPADLTLPDEAVRLADELKKRRIPIDVLINNAGFGDRAAFLDSDWDKQRRMIELNIVALMQMSYVFGREMTAARSGSILNIASIAGIMYSGPYMSVYYATKAFVLSFSQSLNEELKGTGVSVSALCPGPVSTGFNEAASLTEGFHGMKPAAPESVAADAFWTIRHKRPVRIHGAAAKLAAFGIRFLPRSLVARIAADANGRKTLAAEKNGAAKKAEEQQELSTDTAQ